MPMVMRLPVRLALGLVMMAGHAAAQARPAASESLMFVSNEASRDVSVVRLSDLTVVATIPMRERPRGIQRSPNGRRVYVALSDSIPTVQSAGDAIGVIDV